MVGPLVALSLATAVGDDEIDTTDEQPTTNEPKTVAEQEAEPREGTRLLGVDVSSNEATIIAALVGLAGVGFALLLDARLERRAFARATADEVADVYRLVWGHQRLSELLAALDRVTVRLRSQGIDDNTIRNFAEVAYDCWMDSRTNMEQNHNDPARAGIPLGRRQEFRRRATEVQRQLADVQRRPLLSHRRRSQPYTPWFDTLLERHTRPWQ